MSAELVAGVQAGNPDALGQLYTLFARRWRYFIAHALPPAEIEDHINSLYVTVVCQIRAGTCLNTDALAAWVHGIARHYVYQQIELRIRDRNRFEPNVGWSGEGEHANDLDTLYGRELSPEKSAYMAQLAELIDLVFTEIKNPTYREILVLCYLDGMSDEDAQIKLRINAKTFRNSKHRAREQFKAALSHRLRVGRRLRPAA